MEMLMRSVTYMPAVMVSGDKKYAILLMLSQNGNPVPEDLDWKFERRIGFMSLGYHQPRG